MLSPIPQDELVYEMSWLTAFTLGLTGSLLSAGLNAWLQATISNASVRAR